MFSDRHHFHAKASKFSTLLRGQRSLSGPAQSKFGKRLLRQVDDFRAVARYPAAMCGKLLVESPTSRNVTSGPRWISLEPTLSGAHREHRSINTRMKAKRLTRLCHFRNREQNVG
jgi:hypothetical protein